MPKESLTPYLRSVCLTTYFGSRYAISGIYSRSIGLGTSFLAGLLDSLYLRRTAGGEEGKKSCHEKPKQLEASPAQLFLPYELQPILGIVGPYSGWI